MKTIKTGSDFSGVGAFDYAINRVSKEKGFNHERVFACDWDKFARITYAHNHGTPKYYPHDVYEREIPEKPLDAYITSPPCQDFSIAGKTPEESSKTILFFNSLEFIQVNKPRFFIFENVKGLLSHNKSNKEEKIGKTFREWLNLLGGKSVNGLPILFKDENAVDYHIYWKVLNTKKYGVPQNRERVFIVGIRDDVDNSFTWPKEEYLTTKLKDILENEVDEKYFLSDKMVNQLLSKGINTDFLDVDRISNTLRCGGGGSLTEKHSFDMIKIIGNTNPSGNGMNGNVFDEDGSGQPVICVPVLTPDRAEKRQNGRRFKNDGDPSFTLTAQDKHGIFDGMKIRRLTPRECFRLQDFPEDFDFSVVSDSQAYKQAGNSITVRVLELILLKLNL